MYAVGDPVGLHRFLWANHLAYAASYEVPKRFGVSNINPTRLILFDKIVGHLRSRGLDPRKDVRSVFEVGCSMGYLLRCLEEEVFPSATILHGLDIDAYAVKAGTAHLSSLRSRVQLFAADLDDAERVMCSQIGGGNYDLVLCCGVLMYVNESTAEKASAGDVFARRPSGRSDLPGSSRSQPWTLGGARVGRNFRAQHGPYDSQGWRQGIVFNVDRSQYFGS